MRNARLLSRLALATAIAAIVTVGCSRNETVTIRYSDISNPATHVIDMKKATKLVQQLDGRPIMVVYNDDEMQKLWKRKDGEVDTGFDFTGSVPGISRQNEPQEAVFLVHYRQQSLHEVVMDPRFKDAEGNYHAVTLKLAPDHNRVLFAPVSTQTPYIPDCPTSVSGCGGPCLAHPGKVCTVSNGQCTCGF